MDQRANQERRRSLRRGNDLTAIKRKLAIGLTILATLSFTLGYLSGSGRLEFVKLAAGQSAAIARESK